ncbi:unnamed protein product, partial [Mesorhabditis belari]|uniref:NAD(+) diphosphatase n=1 Tax=Mesorhabditis belari TaxID=2138241 RepID=A0AAF3J6K9_9BILA
MAPIKQSPSSYGRNPLLKKKRFRLDGRKKMSSYGAIGAENDDIDTLLSGDRPGIRRVASSSRILTTSASEPARTRADSRGERRPYLYTGGLGLSRDGSTQSLTTEDEHRDHAMAIRYRLFNRLDPGGHTLRMPDHVVPPDLFSVLPFDDFKDNSGKQNSLVTIFSIWNTMMGTSLLAMPWAMQQAGLALGIFLMISIAGLSLYTAYRVVQSPKHLPLGVDSTMAEFSDVCKYLFGKPGEIISVSFSIAVLLGGVMVYWVLMSNFLYYTGNVVYEALQPNSTTIPIMENKTFTCDVYCPENFNEKLWPEEYNSLLEETSGAWSFDKFWKLQGTVPIYLAFLTFPLMNFKSPTFFTKFNVLGTISVLYLLIFTASKLFECGINMDFKNPTSEHYVKLFSWKFPALTGTLTLSYFIHNAVLTILRNQKNPENNARDLSIGYLLACFCYVFIGFTFFAAFPVQRSCISDNFLNNFGSGDVLSSTARLFLLFQMITVLPLLMYLIRSQIFYYVFGKPWPGFTAVLVLNACVVGIAVLVAIFYPHVGSILRYVGSLSGLVYVFALPCMRQLFPYLIIQRGIGSYVERVRLFDHWQLHDEALTGRFPRGAFLLMVDKKPLIKKINNDVHLITHSFKDLRSKLGEYGLGVTLENSCLVDVIDSSQSHQTDEGYPMALFGTSFETITPPEDSPISHDDIRNKLAKSLGGRFIDLRMAMLTLLHEKERNWLARMQSLSRFARTYRQCSKCATVLRIRTSKSGAECIPCKKVYYPTYSPVTICLISDPTNEHALLVRHRGSANGIYTCVAGFATAGEPLNETCRREIAEEVGIETMEISQLGLSQPWPMPDSSLMIGFKAMADRSQKIKIAPDELENAQWFTRDQVAEALKRTEKDPFLKGISKSPDDRQTLRYIPPHGAIAYSLIQKWVLKEI